MPRRPILFAVLLSAAYVASVQAYIDVTPTLGRLIGDSTNIVLLRLERVNPEKRALLFKKVADLKGTSSDKPVRHLITAGLHPREPALIMEWAEPGQLALCFHNGKVAEVCVGNYWYECTV